MRRDKDARGLRFTGRATCARCSCQDGDRRASWDRDPVDVVGLDCISPRWEPWRAMLRPELRALAALAARHQKEFRTLLERETVLEALADGPG
jgi:hypothetical protein